MQCAYVLAVHACCCTSPSSCQARGMDCHWMPRQVSQRTYQKHWAEGAMPSMHSFALAQVWLTPATPASLLTVLTALTSLRAVRLEAYAISDIKCCARFLHLNPEPKPIQHPKLNPARRASGGVCHQRHQVLCAARGSPPLVIDGWHRRMHVPVVAASEICAAALNTVGRTSSTLRLCSLVSMLAATLCRSAARVRQGGATALSACWLHLVIRILGG